jgi:hypothetical protein
LGLTGLAKLPNIAKIEVSSERNPQPSLPHRVRGLIHHTQEQSGIGGPDLPIVQQ